MAQKCKIHMKRNDNQVVEAEIEGLDAEAAGAAAGAEAGATAGAEAGATAGAEAGATAGATAGAAAGAEAGAEAGSTALTSITGYDATKTQTLTNDQGTLKWVDNE